MHMYYHRQRKFTYILIYLGAMHFAFINSSVYYCLLTYLFRGKKLPIKKTFTSCISTYLVVVVVPFIRCKDIKKFFKKATPLASFTLYIYPFTYNLIFSLHLSWVSFWLSDPLLRWYSLQFRLIFVSGKDWSVEEEEEVQQAIEIRVVQKSGRIL